jgi:aspartyl-tRNA(Asn)/glutamyl-tRNA(Gln) amidotransferase subunit B
VAKKHGITPKNIANTIINKKVNTHEILPAHLVQAIVAGKKTVTIDENKLQKIIAEVIKENEKAVTDYKNGKETVIMFLVGQTIRKLGEKVDAQMVKDKLERVLK